MSKLLIFWLQLVLFSSYALAENWYPSKVESVHDGDSAILTIDFPLGISVKSPVRFIDYDAYEISRVRKTVIFAPDEIKRGKAAKAALIELLGSGAVEISIDPKGRDRYSRVLAKARVNTEKEVIYISNFMKENGHDRGSN